MWCLRQGCLTRCSFTIIVSHTEPPLLEHFVVKRCRDTKIGLVISYPSIVFLKVPIIGAVEPIQALGLSQNEEPRPTFI